MCANMRKLNVRVNPFAGHSACFFQPFLAGVAALAPFLGGKESFYLKLRADRQQSGKRGNTSTSRTKKPGGVGMGWPNGKWEMENGRATTRREGNGKRQVIENASACTIRKVSSELLINGMMLRRLKRNLKTY